MFTVSMDCIRTYSFSALTVRHEWYSFPLHASAASYLIELVSDPLKAWVAIELIVP